MKLKDFFPGEYVETVIKGKKGCVVDGQGSVYETTNYTAVGSENHIGCQEFNLSTYKKIIKAAQAARKIAKKKKKEGQ